MNPALKHRLVGIHKFLTNPNERIFFRLSIRYGNGKRYKPVKIRILNYNFNVPDALSFIWQFKEIFVDEYYRFEPSLKYPVIFDCGANVGTSCAFFKLHYPHSRIVAFEPNPTIESYLKTNIKNNLLNHIEVINKAVWVDENGVDLGLEDADGSSIYMEKNKIKVDSVRLKNYIDKEETIDMLKMDIEGAEVEVLMDCKNSLRNVKNIFVEFHSYKNNPQKLSTLLAVLEENDFKYYILQPESRSRPFLNRINKSNPNIDLQLNIFGYR